MHVTGPIDPTMAAPTRAPLRSVLIVVYLAVQLVVPLRGFVQDKLASRGNFSWNMYSKRYDCEVEYMASLETGEVLEVDYQRFFRRPDHASMVLHGDVLPEFHRYMCDVLAREAHLVRLDGICLCSLNDGSSFHLIERDVDICTAPDHAVIQP